MHICLIINCNPKFYYVEQHIDHMVSTYQSVSSLILNQRKICVVTGGTDGIGKAIAAQLALIGHFVIIVARNELKGQRVVQDINEKCCESRVVFYRADLSLLELQNWVFLYKQTAFLSFQNFRAGNQSR